MAWPTDKAKAHIERLAGVRDIAVHWHEKPPYAYTPHRMIFVPPPTTGERYMACLHELGHCASRMALKWERIIERNRKVHEHWPPQLEIMMESAAWAWAAEMADPDLVAQISHRDRARIAGMWASYLFHEASARHE